MGTSGSKPEGNDTGKCRLDKDEMRRLQNEFRTFIDKRDMINEREFKVSAKNRLYEVLPLLS